MLEGGILIGRTSMKRFWPGLLWGLWGATGFAAAPAASTGLSVQADTSPQIAAEITAGLPGFGEVKKAPDKPVAPDPSAMEMAAHIKRLPQQHFQPPHGEEVLTQTGKADAAMNQYLGKADGFDRGFLNRYNLPAIWASIPLLKYLPCPLPGISNEQRALDIKSDLDFHQALQDEGEFSSLGKMEQTALPAAADPK